MLARAADTLSLKLAGAEAKQDGLVLAAQEAHSRMEAAEVHGGARRPWSLLLCTCVCMCVCVCACIYASV